MSLQLVQADLKCNFPFFLHLLIALIVFSRLQAVHRTVFSLHSLQVPTSIGLLDFCGTNIKEAFGFDCWQ
jgi:hypothetical protein